MHNHILEDVDLLEAVMVELSLQEEESITEATISGVKITKENLQDEKFVRDLVKKIKEYDVDKKEPGEVQKFFNGLLGIIIIISTLTIVLIPVVLLITSIVLKFTPKAKSERDLEKLDNCIEKTIKKLNDQKNKSKDKEKYEEAIKKLEENRNLVSNRTKFLSVINVVDSSKYTVSGDIKLNDTVFYSIAGRLSKTKSGYFDNKIESAKKELNGWKNDDYEKLNFDNIEQLSYHGIDGAKLLKLVDKNKGNIKGDYIHDRLKETNSTLKDKTCTYVCNDGKTYVLYCHEDNCCYTFNEETGTGVPKKLSVQQLLQASKQSYDDLMKIIKAYEK